MRELTVRIRFTKHCLGNCKDRQTTRFMLPRSTDGRHVVFPQTWHKQNLKTAAAILGRHQDEVDKILWDWRVDGRVQRGAWYHRYYGNDNGRKRYCVHESFYAGQVIGLNCVVPNAITDDDFWRLMALAGTYCGLSPYKPHEWGFYEVESLQRRRAHTAEE